GRVHVDVFDAGEFRIKAGAQFEQRGDPSFMPNFTVRGFERTGDNLQQRGLAATVGPDDADHVALVDFKRDILQRPKLFVSSQAAARQRLFEPIAGPRIGPVLLGHVVDTKRDGHSLGNVSEVGRGAKGQVSTAAVATGLALEQKAKSKGPGAFALGPSRFAFYP